MKLVFLSSRCQLSSASLHPNKQLPVNSAANSSIARRRLQYTGLSDAS
jgi:hypothetical protein